MPVSSLERMASASSASPPPERPHFSRRTTAQHFSRKNTAELASALQVAGETLDHVLPPGVTPDELGTEAERVKNRKMLKHTHDSHRNLQTDFERFKQSVMPLFDQLSAQNAEISRLKEECRRIETTSQSVGQLSARSTEIASELSNFKGLLGNVTKQSSELKGQVGQVKNEVTAMKKDIQGVKGEKVGKEEIDRLKQGIHSKDAISRIEAKSDLATFELRGLVKQLWDRGVLAPAMPEVKEEERPPVGTLELGQDIFTARLLMRLGMMKHKAELAQEEEMSLEEGYSDDDLASLANGNVVGLAMPDMEEGSSGHLKVVIFSFGICGMTFVLQLVVLLIMLHNARKMEGDCLDEPLPWPEWCGLHVSKSLALTVTGTMMGKDLMDAANYWMVAELLLPSRSAEVLITTVLRVGLTLVVVAATMFIFLTLTNPVDVWLNMTALGFITRLGSDVLEVGKRGLFGHHVAKATTSLNFELTFMAQYPSWFSTVHRMTAAATLAGVVTFALITFSIPDLMCS